MRNIKIFCPTYLGLILFFYISGCAFAETVNQGLTVTPQHQNTNVILISIDTLRYDHLGCYGYQRSTSSNIDKLAKQSVLFENFIVQAYLTPVSQMSIFTSQYPRVNGLVSFESSRQDVSLITLPRILKYYGYTNAAFLGSPEFYFGAMVTLNSIFRDSFDIFLPSCDQERALPRSALEWIATNSKKKFFIWVPIGTVHWPYALNVPEPYRSMFDPKDYKPRDNTQNISYEMLKRIYRNKYYTNFSPQYELEKKDVEYILGRYDSGIFITDKFIGDLIRILKQNNLFDNTMIILHSIHGEDLGEHGYFQHYDIYDTEVKNALLIKFPRNKFQGKKISHQVQGIDIMPTILDYLDIPINHEAQGKSLVPLIKYNRSDDSSEFAYITRIPLWEFLLSRLILGNSPYEHSIEGKATSQYETLLRQHFGVYPDYKYSPYDIAVRTNKWKLIVRMDKDLLEKISWWGFISREKITIDEVELYDLEKDPHEQNNVVTKYPDIVVRFKEKLFEWNAENDKRQPKDIKNSTGAIIPYP